MRVLFVFLILFLAGCTAPAEAPSADLRIEPQEEQDPAEETSEPEPSQEPEPEPTQDPEPSPEPEPTSKPEPTSEPEPTQEPEEDLPTEPDWGSPSSKGLRPGINMVTDGAGCTTSFLFHVDWTEYYMATAAHCVSDGDGCSDTPDLPTKQSELRLDGGGVVRANVAYHSWSTMARVGETNADTCDGNDFALLRIPDGAISKMHPASLHFEAPTGLATSPTNELWGYGASSLKFGVSPAHPKQGVHMGMAESGWSHFVYLATPGIPGDSGGHIMTDDGQALGIASRIILTPYAAANYYTDIAKSLEYMETHEGWAPELITWDDFHASLV